MKTFMERKLKEAREHLGKGGFEGDEGALACIENLIFRDPEASRFTVTELEGAVHKIFHKTRSRLGILQPLMEDPLITEIMVNGPFHIFTEREGRLQRCHMAFDSVEELEEIMRGIAAQVHREINELQPIVDARLPDGSRVSGVYKNVAVNGPVLTIRRFSTSYMTMSSLVEGGTITPMGAELMKCLTACGYNIFVSGGTSSGKTTFLNALADYIPPAERIIIVEDSSELKLSNVENIVHMECRNANTMGRGQVTMAQLIKASLRMRPDRIVVGEVRGEEVMDMLQAMNTGHSGMSTGHGNSVHGMLQRLETLYMMAMSLDMEAVRLQISGALDIMVHLERMDDGMRQVVEICEIAGYENGRYVLNPLMVRDENGVFRKTENLLMQKRKAELKGGDYVCRLREMGFVL